MSSPPSDEITKLLRHWSDGDASALAPLMDLVYPELHRIAARLLSRERADHTLQPTALVNEAYVRLAQPSSREWQDRTHFYAVAARVARAVLVDHARARVAVKRGDGAIGIEVEEQHAMLEPPPVDVLDLDNALRALEQLDPEQGRIVELRYFAGLSIEETAQALGMSASSVKRGWLTAKTWIRVRLDGGAQAP